ncbi:MAG: putative lipid II flippase FtsW [Puniceicoccales bacterium]|jgi:cell division protein FtsW|nr:putative lipid II flippase FtsW [Puniceicoccales bacterium]
MTERQVQPVRASRFWVPASCIIVLAVALTGFGLLMLSSAGAKAPKAGSDPLHILYLQLRFLPVALVAGFVAFMVDIEKLRRWVWWLYGGVCVLLVMVRIPGIGRAVKGSWRWISLGPINIQPSDLGKLVLVLALSHYLANSQRFLRPVYFNWFDVGPKFPWLISFKKNFPWISPTTEAGWDLYRGFILPCCIIGTICGLILIEPDLGTMALCGAVGMTILFVSGARIQYIIPTVLAAVSAFAYVVYNWENRMKRVTSFLDPEGTKANEGYQLWQGMLAFACGGTTGEGLGKGLQQRYFLPEAHTDFIFSIVGEELGLVATGLVVLGFLLLFFVVVFSLRRAHNLYQFNVCLGASLFIILQALINMGVVTGLLPTKGMSLPFISYGGTNLVTMFVMLGLILNCLLMWARPPLMTPREL